MSAKTNHKRRTHRHWRPRIFDISAQEREWLTDKGSLTYRIQSRCSNFSLRRVSQGLAKIAADETRTLHLAQHQHAIARDIFLCCDDTPVIFAHTVLARESLRSTWQSLTTLGNRPLGTRLFSDPRIERFPLYFRKLNRYHSLYRSACKALTAPLPKYLWARRSIFCLHHTSIMVTEVFLPGILALPR